MTTYRRRPAEIEAIQWTGTNIAELRAFAGSDFDTIDPEDRIEDPDQDAQLLVEASHWVGIGPGDWVLKFEGYFVSKRDEAFRAVWEAAAVPSAPVTQAADVDRRNRYAQAIHDAMEPDLSLVDQEPGSQALFARAAEAATAVADAEQADTRAAALREAADAIEEAQHRRDDLVNDALGFLDNNTEQQHLATHRAGKLLRRMATRAQPTEYRHTCHDQTSAPGRDYDCQWCSTLPESLAAVQPKRKPMDPVHILGIKAEPAQPAVVSQPDEETKTTTPYPPDTAWTIQTHRRGTWHRWLGDRFNLAEAREEYERQVSNSGHEWAFRLLRSTTTFAVDAEHQPEDSS